jgi:NAD(P) transhydrogenase subunit beta
MKQSVLDLIYMIGAVSFVFGIKMLGKPEKAKKGNLIAAFGMGLAIFGTIFLYENNGNPLGNYGWIFGGLIVGTVIGTLMAKKVQMTGMPQMVSFFNGMGGACAALISLVEFNHLTHSGDFTDAPVLKLLIIFLGLIIGSISFAGSMIAYGKLDEQIKDKTLEDSFTTTR